MSDKKLPPSFRVEDIYKIRGGVEYGFSSTTRDRMTAEFYAKVNGIRPYHTQACNSSARMELEKA